MLAFRARYVFPVDRPPIRDGVVAIDHDRIVAVGESSGTAVRDLLPAARDLGNVAILPGLINAHTHLEFSDLEQPLGKPGVEFIKWIQLVVAHKREVAQRRQSQLIAASSAFSPTRAHDPVATGIQQSINAGVTALGDIDSAINMNRREEAVIYPAKKQPLPLELTSFLEVISLAKSSIEPAFKILTEEAEHIYRQWNAEIQLGISPHAPYTVHPELLSKCAQLSAARGIPLAHHLAESRDELMLLRTGRGPFVGLLESLKAWDPTAIPFASRLLDYLKILSRAHRALVVHGNYLDDEEIEFVAAHAGNMSIVYCPRTHAFFKHDSYPLAKMLSAGVNLALATDSRASNPDLSILAEMRFAAAQHPVVPPAALLRMITANAARALGREEEIGTLTPGKFADLVVLTLPQHKTATDPHELLLDACALPAAVVFRGRAVYGERILMQQ